MLRQSIITAAIVATLSACGGQTEPPSQDSEPAATEAPATSEAPKTFEVVGALTLGEGAWAMLDFQADPAVGESSPCASDGAYIDIEKAQAIVEGNDGTRLAIGTVGDGLGSGLVTKIAEFGGDESPWSGCRFLIKVEDVPADKGPYSLKINDHEIAFNEEDAGGLLLNLG